MNVAVDEPIKFVCQSAKVPPLTDLLNRKKRPVDNLIITKNVL